MPLFPEPKTSASPGAPETNENAILLGLAKLGVPTLIFGIAFALLSFVLIGLVSPDRFPVRAGDQVVRLRDLETEERSLIEEEKRLTEERMLLRNEDKAPLLSKVQGLSKEFPPLGPALLSLEEVRRSFATSVDPIALPEIEFRAEDGSISIRGEVRDIGGRSVQILAAFVDALRSVAVFERVSEPEYAPVELPDGGSMTPFSMTLALVTSD